MSFKFPFTYAQIPGLGLLFYPVVIVNIKTIYGWREFEFLVDTGAAVSVLPHSASIAAEQSPALAGADGKGISS